MDGLNCCNKNEQQPLLSSNLTLTQAVGKGLDWAGTVVGVPGIVIGWTGWGLQYTNNNSAVAPILIFSGLAIAGAGAVATIIGKSMVYCSYPKEAEHDEPAHARVYESDGSSSALRFHKSDGDSLFATQ